MEAKPRNPSVPPNPSVRRARRRHWRRAIGTVVFAVVAVAIVTVAFKAISAPDNASKASKGRLVTTTVVSTVPPAGPYKVTDGLNVRAGPGRTFPSIGTIELGKEVMVSCVIDGEMVDGPSGPTNKWLRVTTSNAAGYVTSQYVATGAAVNDPAVIPRCSGI